MLKRTGDAVQSMVEQVSPSIKPLVVLYECVSVACHLRCTQEVDRRCS